MRFIGRTLRGMSSFKGSFSSKNDKILQTSITKNVNLRMERVGHAIARVYFVDTGCAEVEIPHGFVITDETNGGAVLPLLDNQYFILAWMDNYSISYHGNSILGLSNQRQWSLSGPRASHVDALDA